MQMVHFGSKADSVYHLRKFEGSCSLKLTVPFIRFTLGDTKMYRDLKQHIWWHGMKREIARFIARCLVCQQVKAEHQRTVGLLQPLPIPEWKWENITMGVVVGLPRSPRGNNAIWVIVDRLTKSAHFISFRVGQSTEALAEKYMQEIVRLHGVPVSIISDRDIRFVSCFWDSLQRSLGSKLKFSTAFHPKTDGQLERTIQIIEDILRACILDFKGSWDDHLHLVEFSYNNTIRLVSRWLHMRHSMGESADSCVLGRHW